MANLQVKNVPEALHQQLRTYATQRNRTVREVVLEALEHELARAEFLERLARRTPADLGVSAASLLEEERARRDADTSA
jgi:plasmid stability protein